jgi:hypothetical protein
LNQAIIITDKLMNKEYLEKTEVRELVEWFIHWL